MKKTLPILCMIALLLVSCNQNTPNYQGTGTGGSHDGGYNESKTPTARFSVAKGTNPLTYDFDASESSYAYEIEWDFGDGVKDYKQKTSHKYDKEGSYVVTLTVKNGSLSDRISKKITVSTPTKCYVTGIRYNWVGYMGKYYYCKLEDDGPWVKKVWLTTAYKLVDQRNIEHKFSSPVLLENVPKHDYYTVYAYWSNNTSKDGTQILRQKIYRNTLEKYPTESQVISDNGDTSVTIYFKWE